MPLTIILKFATVFFIYLVAFPIGIYSATHQYSWGDHGLTFLGFLGLATPNFLLALIMLYLANSWFGVSIGGTDGPGVHRRAVVARRRPFRSPSTSGCPCSSSARRARRP